jgi:hypothetical protein
MKKRLQIELKGASQDLGTDTEGVSLKFFAAYTMRLREAYRRSAQGVVTGTVQDEGRLPARAAQVDIRLKSARGGSLEMDCAAVDTHGLYGQLALPTLDDHLADDALARLMDGLDGAARAPESEEIPRAIRLLIGSLGTEVRQAYRLLEGDRVLREVVLTSAGLEASPEPVLAQVERVPTVVRGITFAPRLTVTLDIDGAAVRASATSALVQKAIGLHDRDDLIATIVTNTSGARLLDIAPAAQPFPRRRPDLEETLDRFADVMKALAL